MKRLLFRILVLGLSALVVLAQTESFAARGGGGRGGGGGEAGGRRRARGQPRWWRRGKPGGWNGRRRTRGRIQQPAFGVGRRLSRRGRPDQERVATQQQPRGWSGSEQECRRRKHQQIPSFFQDPISSERLRVRPAFGGSGK